MSLLNVGQGNSRERLAKLEIEVAKLKGIVNLLISSFELQRKFFSEVTNTILKKDESTHPDDSGS